MNKRSKKKYNDHMLKAGYEAMGQINLGFAESGLAVDAEDYLLYESSLAKQLLSMERDNIDD